MNASPIRSHRQDFSEQVIPEFLNNGWMLALNAEEVLVGWGAWQTNLKSEDVSGGACLYAPDFFLDALDGAWRLTPSWEILERSRFASIVLSGLGRNVNGEEQRFQWVEPELKTFEAQFQSIREGMRERGLKKAVPVVFGTAQGAVDAKRRHQILARVLEQPSHLYPYGYWETLSDGANFGMIGVTPEILFSQNEPESFETVALAGTRAKDQHLQNNLMNDPKERHEHQLVIDDIQCVLKNMGDAQIAQTDVVELPTLVHLRTSIQAHLARPHSFDEIVEALHPTPALGVAPRDLGFEEMRRWDSREERLRFGAPFGARFMRGGEEHRHCLVAIRNIQWQDRAVQLGSGCGIVPASELEKEWQELQLKRESVKRMLGV